MKVIVEPQSSLLDNMNDLRIRNTYCDLKFRLPDDTEFPVHKSFIAARSQYFAEILRSELTDGRDKVLNIFTFDSETLNIVIQYIYSGSVKIEFSNVVRVLQEAVQALDECLATAASGHLDDVVAVTASFPNLPLTNDRLAEIICNLDESKRTTVIEQATTGTMMKVLDHAGRNINDFFSDILEWMKNNSDSEDLWRVYASLDFKDLYTTNIQQLGMLGAKAAIAECDSVQLLLNKVNQRTGKFVVGKIAVANLSSFRSKPVEVGSMKWRLDIMTGIKLIKTRANERVLSLFLNCTPDDNWHLKSYSSVAVFNFALLRYSGPPKRMAKTYTFTENKTTFGLPMISWNELLDESNAFVADGKVEIEAGITIEHSRLEWN